MSNKTTRIIVTIFGGWFGAHKFMDKQIGMGVLYLLTGGLFVFGWIFDIIKACTDKPETHYLQMHSDSNITAIGQNLFELNTDVAGTSYHTETFIMLMDKNSKYYLSDDKLINLGKERVYEFYPLSSHVSLIPDSTNKHDPDAVMVMINDCLVGYVPSEYSLFVKNLIAKNAISIANIDVLGGNVKMIYPNNDVVINNRNFHAKLKIIFKN